MRSTPSLPPEAHFLAQNKELKEFKEIKELKESGAHPDERFRRCAHAPFHPAASSGSSLLAQNKELKDFKEIKELKESGAHRGSDSHRKRRPLPPPQSSTSVFLKILKLLKLLKLLILNLLKSPVQTCIVLRGGVSPPILPRCAGYVTHGSQEASEVLFLWSKKRASPSWLRDFVRDISQDWPSCETSRGVQAVYLDKARTRIRTYARSHAHTYALARGRVRPHARALPGSIRNPYGFRFKPIRVSSQTRTGFKQTPYGSSKIRNAECRIRNALTRQVTPRQEVEVFRNFDISKLRNYEKS